jgi:hypothetical protein
MLQMKLTVLLKQKAFEEEKKQRKVIVICELIDLLKSKAVFKFYFYAINQSCYTDISGSERQNHDSCVKFR